MNEEILRADEKRQSDSGITGTPLDSAAPDAEQTQPHAEGPDHLPGAAGRKDQEGPFPGFLELLYGVFFEPRTTMKRVAGRPPLGHAALVVTILSALGTAMWLLTAASVLGRVLHAASLDPFASVFQALAPLAAVTVFLWGFLKWFVYSSVLSLAAELLGGLGRARGVFAASGLAGLPALLMAPVQLISYGTGAENLAGSVLSGLAGVTVAIWSIVLTVMGVREVHGLSIGRSVLAVLSPYLAMITFLLFLFAALAVAAAALPSGVPLLNYF